MDDTHPLPNVEDLFARLGDGKIFTQLDLSDAYHQIEMTPKSVNLLTINTHLGRFRYRRLPFGVKPAPSIFQRILEQCVGDLPGIFVYLDDILIVAPNAAEHEKRVEAVLTRLQEWGFRLALHKCKFAMTTLKYLCRIVSAEGIRAEAEPTIEKLKTPTSKAEVRALLGGINYYGRFIPNLHRLKEPLERLLPNETPFQWGSEQTAAFGKLKEVLTSDLLLTHFDPKQTLVVAADASDYGIGGVLIQRDSQGQEKAVLHMSKTLNAAQRNYSQIEKEALALVLAIERFHKFVGGGSSFYKRITVP